MTELGVFDGKRAITVTEQLLQLDIASGDALPDVRRWRTAEIAA